MNEAWVTLATNDTYGLGAMVLGRSLRRVNTTRKLCCMVTPEVTESMKTALATVWDEMVLVNVLDSNDVANLALIQRPELGVTFTKLHCWTLSQYNKAVFLDADTLVIRNCDELFEQDELSAVTDIGWPDCFNSGVFVFRPNPETFDKLLKMAVSEGSFDGGDQGLLNQYFPSWNRLSFIYNMVAAITYTYTPAYKRYGDNVRIVHFLGSRKPWDFTVTESGDVQAPMGEHYGGVDHVRSWWSIFVSDVRPRLSSGVSGLASRLATMSLENSQRLRQWEVGTPDFQGGDSFDNIQRRIAESIQKGAQQPAVQEAQQQAANIAQSAQQGASQVVGATQETLQSAVESTKAATQSAVESTKAATQFAVESTKAAAQSAVESTKAATQSAVESTKAATQSAVESTKAATQAVGQTASGAVETAKNVTQQVGESAAAAVQSAAHTAQAALQSVEQSTMGLLQQQQQEQQAPTPKQPEPQPTEAAPSIKQLEVQGDTTKEQKKSKWFGLF